MAYKFLTRRDLKEHCITQHNCFTCDYNLADCAMLIDGQEEVVLPEDYPTDVLDQYVTAHRLTRADLKAHCETLGTCDGCIYRNEVDCIVKNKAGVWVHPEHYTPDLYDEPVNILIGGL